MTGRGGLSPGSRDPLETSVLFDVFALGQAVGALLDDAMAGGPLSPEEYAFYSAIFELETTTPSRLASRLGMPLTTVMDVLARVEARGHVRRMRNPADRRATLVVLTATGLSTHKAANAAFEAAYGRFVAELPGGEAAAHATLGEIRGAVERATTTGRVQRAPRRTSHAPRG
jgi:DNA-binding MarR family transcriptional regulator